MTLPARNRPPPPMPGSPEALQAEEERNRIIAASRAQTTALAAPKASGLATSLAPLPPLPPSKRLEKIPVAKYDMTTFHGPSGAEIPVMDMDTVPVDTGMKPADRVPHEWGMDPQDLRSKNAPDWLNDNGGQTKVCRVCGVTMRSDLIRPDRKGMKYHYVDAFGLSLTSMIELFCPTFIGDTNGAVGEAKQRVRHLDVQMETVHDRLDRLEADNQYLREQLEAKIQLDVTGLVEWLGQIAKMSATAHLPTTQVSVAGLPLEIPTPMADLIRGVGEAVTVDVTFEEDEDPKKGIV